MNALLLAALLAAAPDTLVVGTLAEPVTLEPHRATDLVSAAIVSNICETLVRFRPGSTRPEAGLALSWATLDQRVWTFTLRPGVRFHDGAPLDAEAVIANLEHLRGERAFPGRATRIGPTVVEVTLERPNAALLATLSQPFFALESPRRMALGHGGEPVGTGPFRLGAVGKGGVELLAHATHWGGAPRLRRLVFRRFPDEAALLRALEAGDVDVTSALSQTRMAELRQREDVTLDSLPGLSLVYLALNGERTPFADGRVRRALARGVDRDALIRDLLGGHGEAAHTPLPPALWGHDSRARDLFLDRATARRLLARASVPSGFQATLTVSAAPRPYLPAPLAVAARLRDDLLTIGVDLRIREVGTWAEQVALTSGGDFDTALLGWQADSPDPNDFLTALLDSASVGTTNRSRYRSATVDSLLKRARQARDLDARLGLYRQVQERFQKDMPFVPLYHAPVFTAYRREVRGLVVGATGIPRYDKAWKTR